jgi:chromosome segregation ATPase
MKITLLVLLAATLLGCQTMRAVPAPVEAAAEYRAVSGELQKQQAEIAITGVKIEGESRGLAEGLEELEAAMTAAPYGGGTWLPQVHSLRENAEDLHSEVENLNRQLSTEREQSRLQEGKFNEYESVTQRDMSNMGTEINTLRVELKKVTGDKNTLLAIVITAISVIVLLLAIWILRKLKVIPI